jgi:hypothetical protein
MFYTQCWKCNERWALGTASTCKCPDETPKRKWVGLTNEERADCWETIPELAMRKVEAKLKEKNT